MLPRGPHSRWRPPRGLRAPAHASRTPAATWVGTLRPLTTPATVARPTTSSDEASTPIWLARALTSPIRDRLREHGGGQHAPYRLGLDRQRLPVLVLRALVLRKHVGAPVLGRRFTGAGCTLAESWGRCSSCVASCEIHPSHPSVPHLSAQAFDRPDSDMRRRTPRHGGCRPDSPCAKGHCVVSPFW